MTSLSTAQQTDQNGAMVLEQTARTFQWTLGSGAILLFVAPIFGLPLLLYGLFLWLAPRPKVIVDDAGLTITSMTKSRHYAWQDITGFGVRTITMYFFIPLNRLAYFDYVDPVKASGSLLARVTSQKQVFLPQHLPITTQQLVQMLEMRRLMKGSGRLSTVPPGQAPATHGQMPAFASAPAPIPEASNWSDRLSAGFDRAPQLGAPAAPVFGQRGFADAGLTPLGGSFGKRAAAPLQSKGKQWPDY